MNNIYLSNFELLSQRVLKELQQKGLSEKPFCESFIHLLQDIEEVFRCTLHVPEHIQMQKEIIHVFQYALEHSSLDTTGQVIIEFRERFQKSYIEDSSSLLLIINRMIMAISCIGIPKLGDRALAQVLDIDQKAVA